MKRLNIQSLLQAKKSLTNDCFEEFLRFYGVAIRDAEIEDLNILVSVLVELVGDARGFDKFYIGYTIPQIGKEFDLLRFGKEFVLNLEIKSESTEDKIRRQLIKNKYYLGFLGLRIYLFSFVASSRLFYRLNNNDELSVLDAEEFCKILKDQEVDDLFLPDYSFNPSNYLVSPFNSTEKFLANEYFLTSQQESVKNGILGVLKSKGLDRFVSIRGGAGTGKTLLTYDIVKYLMHQKKAAQIFHCGQLNDGHHDLVKNGWNISPIKDYKKHDFGLSDVIVIDEAQRMTAAQLDFIVLKARAAQCSCIFSHDKLQVLSAYEKTTDASAKIDAIEDISSYKLSEKIRSNKEIATFTKMLFKGNGSIPLQNNGNIQVNYFSNAENAKAYLKSLNPAEWKVLRFTPSQYVAEHHVSYSSVDWSTSHRVIGQEFENVAVAIDQFFDYDKNGDLIYRKKTYYEPAKMLFQNITRCRKNLNIVIINNETLLSRCLALLK